MILGLSGGVLPRNEHSGKVIHVGYCAVRRSRFSKSNDSPARTVIALFCNNSFILPRTGLRERSEFVGRSNKLENIAGTGAGRIVLLSCFYRSTDSINERSRCSDFNP